MNNSLAQFLIAATFLGLFWLSLWVLALFSRSVLKDKYKTDVKGIKVGIAVYDVIQAKIVEKLIEFNWYTPSKVEKLISIYEKLSENLKFKIPVIPSVFVMLFIPLWSQFIGWIYKNISNFEEGLKLFCMFTVAILTISIILLIIKSFFENTFIGFINKDYYNMKTLIRRLEDILLGMDEKSKIDSDSTGSVVKINQSNKKKKTV